MQIICISCHSYGFGKELAEKLAKKLGYYHIAREELTDQATELGIPVGKIETAILKQQLITEELSIEIERFKAFISANICERAKKGGVVYHGRMGHLVLQGIPNVLRIRAEANLVDRIIGVMQRMNLNRNQAESYIEQVDEDRCRYTRFFYHVDCNEPALYDLVINSSNFSIDNSIGALVHLAKLPEFQFSSASKQKVNDLLIRANCRLAIGADERTNSVKVELSVNDGNVSVTYLPVFEKQAEFIPDVLENVENIKSLVCTVAATNILYIQEKFDPAMASFNHLLEIAAKWNASVELVRLVHQAEVEREYFEEHPSRHKIIKEEDGGILDDSSEPDETEKVKYGMPETINKLIQVGRAGAVNTVYGGIQSLSDHLKRSRGNCLVVVGEVYLSSGSATRKRLKRDMISQLSDYSRVPVISSDDLKEQYLFGAKQWFKTIIYAILSAIIYGFVILNQGMILKFFSASDTEYKILTVIIIGISVPLAAYVISSFWHNILKFVKLE